ncbi:MAG: winged helix-turn-helix domain-containing protein [Proteobacteria bacterium]|nr:winged helix-turn-helix domain-containing protein [Pseudomonadota bacterium]
MPTDEELQKGFDIGDWEVLPARGELRCGDSVVKPEPKVMAVLLSLARRDGDLVTRDQLVDEVWGGRAMPDDPINRCLSQLRGHLDDQAKPYQYIETLTKRGYCLLQDVRLKEPAELAPVARGQRAQRRGMYWGIAAVVAVVIISVLVFPRPPKIGSIGVLPFENLSGDPADQYLVDGFKMELVKTLSNIPDFLVKSGRVSYPGLEVTEIARELDVESVFSGAMQRDGDMLKVNYEVARGDDGKIKSSGSITVSFEDIFDGQEKLAVTVRNDLLGESKRQLISSSRPESFDGYDRYMRGLYAFENRDQTHNLEAAIRLFRETIELDSQFGPAYLALSMSYLLLPDYALLAGTREAPLAETHAMAITVVEQGISVDESIRDAANTIYGFVYQKQRNWSLAEQAYQRATRAQTVESTAFLWYSLMLANVGRLDDALQQALAAQRIDPSLAVINSRVALAYAWLDDNDNASEFFTRTKGLDWTGASHLLSHALFLRRQGRVDEAGQAIIEGLAMAGGQADWTAAVIAGLSDPKQVETSLAALDRAAIDQSVNLRVEVVFRTLLGDIDGAMRVANRLTDPEQSIELDFLFLPDLLPIQQHPGFLSLMDDLGIARYWDETGCIWQDFAVKCPEIL